MHMLMAVFEMAVSSMKAIVQLNAENISVEPSIIEKFTEMSSEFSDSALAPIMFTFIALSLLIVVLPMVTEKKAFRWVTFIIGALLTLMNFIDGTIHIAEGDVFNGLYTFLISGCVGLVASISAYKWIKE